MQADGDEAERELSKSYEDVVSLMQQAIRFRNGLLIVARLETPGLIPVDLR
jgi:hypothetical protein